MSASPAEVARYQVEIRNGLATLLNDFRTVRPTGGFASRDQSTSDPVPVHKMGDRVRPDRRSQPRPLTTESDARGITGEELSE